MHLAFKASDALQGYSQAKRDLSGLRSRLRLVGSRRDVLWEMLGVRLTKTCGWPPLLNFQKDNA